MMKNLFCISLLFVLLLGGKVSATGFDNEPLFDGAYAGVLIKEVNAGEALVDYNSSRSFVPASVMKLVTTATVLEIQSSEYTFKTKLSITGEVKDGILYGDVIVTGAGDPTLGSSLFYGDAESFLSLWASQLREAGIEQIQGAVVADASVFDQRVIPDKWIWEDLGNYYGAGCYGLSCFDNQYRLFFDEVVVGQVANVSHCLPNVEGLVFDSHVTGANNNRDNAYIYGSPWRFEKQIYGTIPAGRSGFMIKGALPNPPLVLARRFKEVLEEGGCSVSESSRVAWDGVSVPLELVSVVESPTLKEIVCETNKKSNNLFAEHLLKSLAVSENAGASFSDAIEVMMSFWQAQGVTVDGVKVYDGSGLSRANLLTPQFVVEVIDYMRESKSWEAFSNSFAVAGRDGTFKYFLDDTKLEGLVRGKSGSMSGVRCYAGVYEKSADENYTFCVMLNNYTMSGRESRAVIEKYLLSVFD